MIKEETRGPGNIGKIKSLILLVEDNEDILTNLKIFLELNGYEVLTADNGATALDLLNSPESRKLPDLIISDIMMPEMNGYELFKEVSKNPLLNTIPFVYLTAKGTPEDINLGKRLGIDDYIVKPFQVADLLAIISGKLAKVKSNRLMSKKLNEFLTTVLPQEKHSKKYEKDSIILLYVEWNDKTGPELKDSFPEKTYLPFLSTDQLVFQLFNAISSIYGNYPLIAAQSLHLNIENINRQGFLFFDCRYDASVCDARHLYMLGVIAPEINYFKSLELKQLFSQISSQIKRNGNSDIKNNWEKTVDILISPII